MLFYCSLSPVLFLLITSSSPSICLSIFRFFYSPPSHLSLSLSCSFSLSLSSVSFNIHHTNTFHDPLVCSADAFKANLHFLHE
uniref:Putative secreted protein n=1 Tax=Anopheles darlingi TaxID=43151 RepID=A0A2M4DIR9_ANODA